MQFTKIYAVIEEKVANERVQEENASSELRSARRRIRMIAGLFLFMVLFVGANVSATGFLSFALLESTKELHAVRSNQTARGESNDPTAGARLKDNTGDVVATREAMSKLPLFAAPVLTDERGRRRDPRSDRAPTRGKGR